MSLSSAGAALRCATHPGRPAHDRCPRCSRLRCAADASRYAAAGCVSCRLGRGTARPVRRLELGVRAALSTMPTVLLGGWIATQYVNDHVFSWLVPGLLGLAAAACVSAAGWRDDGVLGWSFALAAVAAVLGTALGFRLVPGGRQSVLQPLDVVAAPYLAAVVGAGVWPLLFPARKAGRGKPD